MSFKLDLEEQEVNIIGEALAELPFKKVSLLFQKISQQVITQRAAPLEETEVET